MIDTTKRYAVLVIADNSGQWTGNQMRYATEAEARDAARDLEARWTLVRQWKIVRMRWAEVQPRKDAATDREQVQDYLPPNYQTVLDGERLLIEGYDDHGWNLHAYVLPRLGSGLWRATEIVEPVDEKHDEAQRRDA